MDQTDVDRGENGSGVTEGTGMGPLPDPEVLARPKRRTFTAEYKRQILEQAEALAGTGQIGAMLRREGLYTTHLSSWRREEREGKLAARTPAIPGRKAKEDPATAEIARLKRQVARLETKLVRAQTLLEVQKKVSAILEIPLNPPTYDGSGL